jgi:hypothetical protein
LAKARADQGQGYQLAARKNFKAAVELISTTDDAIEVLNVARHSGDYSRRSLNTRSQVALAAAQKGLEKVETADQALRLYRALKENQLPVYTWNPIDAHPIDMIRIAMAARSVYAVYDRLTPP